MRAESCLSDHRLGLVVHLLKRLSPTKLDAATVIDGDAFNPHLVAHFADVFDTLNAAVGHLTDMDETVLAR